MQKSGALGASLRRLAVFVWANGKFGFCEHIVGERKQPGKW